jgi:leucyl-tRNA synthetase
LHLLYSRFFTLALKDEYKLKFSEPFKNLFTQGMVCHPTFKTEKGKWVLEHAVDQPVWHRLLDPTTYGYKYKITARLKAVDYTFWTLKWNSAN